METGRSSDNTRRYIDMNNLANHLGSQVCKALSGLHALTGCDYESSFTRKGKVRPLQITRGNNDFLKGLSITKVFFHPTLPFSKFVWFLYIFVILMQCQIFISGPKQCSVCHLRWVLLPFSPCLPFSISIAFPWSTLCFLNNLNGLVKFLHQNKLMQ